MSIKTDLYFNDYKNIDNVCKQILLTKGNIEKNKGLVFYDHVNVVKIKNAIRYKFKKFVIDQTLLNLPDNNYYPRHDYIINKLETDNEFYFKEYARITKWLQIIIDNCEMDVSLSYLCNYINKHSSSSHGIDSKHNKIDIWLLSRIGSPYTTANRIKYYNIRCKRILEKMGFFKTFPSSSVLTDLMKTSLYLNDGEIKIDVYQFAFKTLLNTFIYDIIFATINGVDEHELNYKRIGELDKYEIFLAKILTIYLLEKYRNLNYYAGTSFLDDLSTTELKDLVNFMSKIRDTDSPEYLEYSFKLL